MASAIGEETTDRRVPSLVLEQAAEHVRLLANLAREHRAGEMRAHPATLSPDERITATVKLGG